MPGDDKSVSINYAALPREVEADHSILLDDGLLKLKVKSTSDTDIECVVEVGGELSDNKGLNIPGAVLQYAGTYRQRP